MIQDSVNQMLGSAAGLAYGGRRLANEREQDQYNKNKDAFAAGKQYYETMGDSQIDLQKELNAGPPDQMTDRAIKAAAAGTQEAKHMMNDAAEKLGLYAQSEAAGMEMKMHQKRKEAMDNARLATWAKQQQANSNFAYIMGQKVDLSDPNNAGLAKVYEKYKETK